MAKKAKKATKKAATKKAAPKKAATKKAATKKTASKRKPNPAFMKPLTPSATLAAVVGAGNMPRTQVVKKLWDYIKKHKLQDQNNKRNINADEKLKAFASTDEGLFNKPQSMLNPLLVNKSGFFIFRALFFIP